MKKNIIFCLFTVVLVFFLSVVPVLAKTTENTIEKIVIESPSKNSYTLNMLFKETYKGNAFLQKLENGSYYVFLTETATNGKKPRIIFKNKSDKSKINIRVEEKPFIQDKKKSNYIRVSVEMADDYSIKLLSGLSSEYKGGIFNLKDINYANLIIIAFLCLALYLIVKIFNQCKEQKTKTYNYSKSYADLKAQTEYLEEMKKKSERNVQRAIEEKTNTKNKIKQADKNSFDCFELPYVEDMNVSKEYEFKSTLNQASKLLKEKPSLVKLRHTNPIITRTGSANISGLQMPAAEDILKKQKKSKIETPQNTNAELISVLNITPNKGFYLTTVDDTLALFGFINENVFLFKKFDDLSQINLQARYYDKHGNNDIYIVRLDDYKAMIEISETSMRELAKI